ncbi:MAG: ATP-dependent helicase HrpB [Pseudomonadota bacterium]
MNLPIDAVLPELLAALEQHRRAVLQAPPGAGKTTRVPLAMLEAGLCQGKIILLEPRRLAARAAAERMAQTRGEAPGATVGYRMRGDSAIGRSTRIEVVTEGILTRMIQAAPDLPGISAVVFDEFHERSLNADLGLALVWEARQALREDLIVLVMSATLDAAPVSVLLDDAPIVSSQGRSFPVETVWPATPAPKDQRLETQLVALIETAIAETDGGILVFLPGEGEIRRVAAALAGRMPKDVALQQLYGALPIAQQRAAIRPLRSGRKLVLSTAIAETSLTIDDITVVIDAGRARRARYDPASGMTRLVTEPVSRAEADQRRGRAGRVAPGICYRNWTRGAEGALPLFAPAEIETGDLAGFALELAIWGGEDALAFLTPPPAGPLRAARRLLVQLGALDQSGRVTNHGRRLAEIPLHPRLAHMLVHGGSRAPGLAALLSERGRVPHVGADLAKQQRAVESGAADKALVARIKAETRRLAKFAQGHVQASAELAMLAYPDRVALRRQGDAPRYLLSGGKGAFLDPGDDLSGQRMLAVTDLDGDAREARIRAAFAISEAMLRTHFSRQIAWVDTCKWSKRTRQVVARQQEMFGALVLSDRVWRTPPDTAVLAAILDGIRELGLDCLGWSDAARRLRARIAVTGLKDVSDGALLVQLEDWAAPFLAGFQSADDLRKFDPADALCAWIGWDGQKQLDKIAPASWTSPLGRKIPIDYTADAPEIALRLQEVFGTTVHPVVGPNQQPLRMVLLSPAGRQVQVTTDLPGFWAGSYTDVRKDMRARYPKHPWPEDPSVAQPTLRAKPRAR